MSVQYDFRHCDNCRRDTKILVRVTVHTGFVAGVENSIDEWTKQWWCPSCIAKAGWDK